MTGFGLTARAPVAVSFRRFGPAGLGVGREVRMRLPGSGTGSLHDHHMLVDQSFR